MKILLLGDASNYHQSLACGLRSLGHSVCVASDGSRWMQTGRDIDLTRRGEGKISGAILYAKLNWLAQTHFRGFDIVQFVNPCFAKLRPCRLLPIFNKLKRTNGGVFLTALGTDYIYIKALTSENPPLEFSEWQTPWGQTPQAKKDQWLSAELSNYTEEFYRNIDGIVSALYEYHHVIETSYPNIPLAYGGIPIITQGLPKHQQSQEKIRILYAAHRGREGEKGADIIAQMLQRLEKERAGKIEILKPGNLPYNKFIKYLASVDIVTDQLYAYTPATTALLAMAMGVIPLTGGHKDYLQFIGEASAPLIATNALDLEQTYSRLLEIIDNTDKRLSISASAPEFVARNNDATVVAQRFVEFWHNQGF